MFEGNSLQVTRLEGDVAELKFDRQNESVNKFDAATIAEVFLPLRARCDSANAIIDAY